MRLNLGLELMDIPGQLMDALEPIGRLGANIVTVIHQRDIKTERGTIPVQITIEGDKGKIIINIAGNNSLLTIFARPDKNHVLEKQGNLISLSSLDGEGGKILLQEFKEKQKVLFAMVAALFSLGRHSIYYMKRSGLKMVYIEGDKRNVIISSNNEKTLIETYIQN